MRNFQSTQKKIDTFAKKNLEGFFQFRTLF